MMKTFNGELVQCYSIAEGNTDYCGTHNRTIRKNESEALKAQQYKQQKFKQQQPRKAPKKVSDKRKLLNEEYFKLVEQFKKDNPKCKANVNELCTGSTDDPHHSRGRGVYLLDISTWLPVCRSCHVWIEDHPNEAKEKGLSYSRLAKTEPKI